MNQIKEKPKRVVSRAEYLGYLVKNLGIGLVGLGLVTTGATGMAIVIVGLCLSYYMMHGMDSSGQLAYFASLIVTAVLSGLLLKGGINTVDTARKMEGVVPITRHNTGHLPADESLVRAASEPPIQPADELLRAAHGGQETAPDQLLRPVPEQKQTL